MTCDRRAALAMALCAVVHLAGLAGGADTAQPGIDDRAPAELTLTAARALLATRSPAIAAARAGAEAARAGRIIAAYRPNPTLVLGAQQFDLGHPAAHWFSDASGAAQRTWTAHVDQPLELGGQRTTRRLAADASADAAAAQVADALRLNRLALDQAFWAAALARDDAQVADDTLAATRDTEGLLRHQVEAGNRSDADLIAFQVGAAQTEQDALAARLAEAQAAADVLTLIACRAPAGGVRIIGGPDAAAASAEPDQTALIAAARLRPDVAAARSQLAAARATLANQRAQRTVAPTVGVEYQRVGGDDAFGFTAQIPLPILNRHEGEIAQAEAQVRVAEAQLVQAERGADGDVRKAIAALDAARRSVALFGTEALARAERSYAIAQAAYRDGATGRAELLDAQRAWNQARISANQARYALAVARAQIAAAAGVEP